MGVTTIFRAAKFFTMEQTQPAETARLKTDCYGQPEKKPKMQKANPKRLAFLNFWSGRWESNPRL